MLCKWLSLELPTFNLRYSSGYYPWTSSFYIRYKQFTELSCYLTSWLHADDTYLTFASNDVAHLEENMNSDLTRITEWLTANSLTLKRSNTEFMLIGSRQRLNTFNRLSSFTINGNSIRQVEFTKSLGVYIGENLTWNVHIKHISKNIASCIGILKRSRSFVPFETLLCICNT